MANPTDPAELAEIIDKLVTDIIWFVNEGEDSEIEPREKEAVAAIAAKKADWQLEARIDERKRADKTGLNPGRLRQLEAELQSARKETEKE